MENTVPGVPQDPDEVTAVEPETPSVADLNASLQLDAEGMPLTFRSAAGMDLVEASLDPSQTVANEAGDSVQGTVIDEQLSPADSPPSHFDFTELYLAYHDPLVDAVCRYCAGDRPLAEDVVQSTFLKAYEKPERLAGYDPYAWLFTVAKRAAQNIFERERLRPDREQARERISGRSIDEWESRTWLIALRQLPPPEDEVMLYRFVRDYSREKIAQKLGISLRAVDYHISRALGRLRRDLNGER